MANRPAIFTRVELARAISEAKRGGASGVEFRPDGTIFVNLSPKTAMEMEEGAGTELASGREINL